METVSEPPADSIEIVSSIVVEDKPQRPIGGYWYPCARIAVPFPEGFVNAPSREYTVEWGSSVIRPGLVEPRKEPLRDRLAFRLGMMLQRSATAIREFAYWLTDSVASKLDDEADKLMWGDQ